jgi:hypothetical protein
MLDTSLSDADRYPLKLSDLIVMDLNGEVAPPKVVWGRAPELEIRDLPNVGFTGDRLYRPMQIIEGPWQAYTGSVLTIDPSGRGKDETGYAVTKVLNGLIYATALGGFTGGYEPSTLGKLAQLAKDHKVNLVLIESNFGDGMFTELIKPHLAKAHPCTVEEIHHSTQKERRIIDTLEPVMNGHRLIVDRRVVEQDHRSVQGLPPEHALKYTALYQLTRITKDRGSLRHDDRLEALAMGVAYWVQALAKDTDLAVDEAKEAWMDAEVQKFLNHCLGEGSMEEKTWISQ